MTPLRLQIFDSPPTSPEFSIETDVSTQCFWTALFCAGTVLNQAGLYYVLTAMHTQNYRLVSKMNTQQGPINCFAIIGEGELLASGGRPSFRFSS
jgi:hypothetical protein